VAFTTVGCVGMIGMNEHGVCVGINNLSGGDGDVGVTWPFVVRKALQQRDLDGALRCVTEARLAGAHNYLLLDRAGRGANVEATTTRTVVTPLEGDAVVHANHCLRRRRSRSSGPGTRPPSRAASGGRRGRWRCSSAAT
jgi:isopenicillin-N N-acyltransferase like protein